MYMICTFTNIIIVQENVSIDRYYVDNNLFSFILKYFVLAYIL